ncbi:MAG: NAD(P)H-dependent oxidoreductase [Pseudomonadota bacterium]
MKRLLYVEGSPRKQRSHSISLANCFLDAYREENPEHEIDVFDLWNDHMPSFAGDTIDAKHIRREGGAMTSEQEQAWLEIEDISSRFQAADVVVVSTPMWNFMAPYVLKHFIDIVTQPGIAFEITREGQYRGLLQDKTCVVLRASGQDYAGSVPLAKRDYFKQYMTGWLEIIGITNVKWIDIAPTIARPEAVAEARERAFAGARSLAMSINP